MKKIKDILTTDIKLINSYLLILIVLVTISVTSMGTYAIFTYDKQSSNLIKIVYQPPPEPLDKSGANVPVLATNMIPVYYDVSSNVWRKADETNSNEAYKWYDYDNKMWANAVTVTSTNRATYLDDTQSPVGTPIAMNDINTMWVWIPRYKATGDTANYNGGTKAAPGAFTINFVGSNEDAHEAFTFGTQELSGMWVGKFENSSNITCEPSDYVAVGEYCNLTNIRPKIIPNATIWRGAMVSTFFLDILNMKENGNQYGFDTSIDTTLDTHMMKNSEWGAVAYLSQSIYGRCSNQTTCPEIGINNNSSFITGYGSPAGSSSTATNGTYETELGRLASTTGNIYGIYDMSGGAYKYVMGVYWDGTKKWSGSDQGSGSGGGVVKAYDKPIFGTFLNSNVSTQEIYVAPLAASSKYYHSGFNGCLGSICSSIYEDGVPYPDEKYYDLYTNTGSETFPVTDYTGDRQHALTETSGWYVVDSLFVNVKTSWFIRGSVSYDSGLFSYDNRNGNAFTYSGSFSVMVK